MESRMPFHPRSRRWFLRTAAAAAAAGSLDALPSANLAHAASPIAEKEQPMPVLAEICPQHVELMLRRSKQQREQLQKSLGAKGARPVTVGVCQMANQCGGEAGKKANLDRMLRAIRLAASKEIQVLAFPEMCLPGYFTRTSGTPAEATRANHALADQPGKSDYLAKLQDAAKMAALVLAFGFCEHDSRDYFN